MKHKQKSGPTKGPGLARPPSGLKSPWKSGVVGPMGNSTSGQPNPTGSRGQQG